MVCRFQQLGVTAVAGALPTGIEQFDCLGKGWLAKIPVGTGLFAADALSETVQKYRRRLQPCLQAAWQTFG